MNHELASRYTPPEWTQQSGMMLTSPHAQNDWASQLDQTETPQVLVTELDRKRIEDIGCI